MLTLTEWRALGGRHNGGWAAELQKSTRNLPEISDKMVFLPDSLLSAVFSCLDAPADFAHCACVSRRWRALSKSAHPYRLLIDWQDREEYLYGRLFWVCDKLSRGQLTVGARNHRALLIQGALRAIFFYFRSPAR